LDRQPEPHGQVLGGEAGVRLTDKPDSIVDIDVAYVAADVMARQSAKSTIVVGVPLLAAEILSPSDTNEEIRVKIETYLEAGVALVWIIDPYARTVTIYRPNAEPTFVNVTQELVGDPHLPGLRIPLAELFR
jgi:Uma2 family endonuclease